jgi:nitrate/nitrite-specific signal transduction histidine kinase
MDGLLVGLLVLLPNLLLILHLHARDALHTPIPANCLLWAMANTILVGILIVLRRRVIQPLQRIAQHMQVIGSSFQQEDNSARRTLLDMRRMAHDVACFARMAQEYYLKYHEASRALDETRRALAQLRLQFETVIESTGHELALHYQSVLAYANHLEALVIGKRIDPSLRYDLDNVCESSMNLRLITSALTALHRVSPPVTAAVPLGDVMQQTLVTLSASLERRNMRLTSAEVDLTVIAESDPAILSQVLWMLLLGTIRYAADESTLRLRSLYSRDRQHAILSIIISELAPGQLSASERAAHLDRQLIEQSPHMFAETIRIHGNLRLAELLLGRIGGQVAVEPLSAHSCEVCLTLPAAGRH